MDIEKKIAEIYTNGAQKLHPECPHLRIMSRSLAIEDLIHICKDKTDILKFLIIREKSVSLYRFITENSKYGYLSQRYFTPVETIKCWNFLFPTCPNVGMINSDRLLHGSYL